MKEIKIWKQEKKLLKYAKKNKLLVMEYIFKNQTLCEENFIKLNKIITLIGLLLY